MIWKSYSKAMANVVQAPYDVLQPCILRISPIPPPYPLHASLVSATYLIRINPVSKPYLTRIKAVFEPLSGVVSDNLSGIRPKV